MKILLAEDNVSQSSTLQKLLKGDGYAVDCSFSGNETLTLYETNSYDLVILDLGLPDMDGIKVCEKIRQIDKSVPVILVTARDWIESKVQGFTSGADDYLAKPYDYAELEARIKSHLKRKSIQVKNELTIDNLKVDLQSKTIERAKTDIFLTAKEFSLLEYLLINSPRIVPKSELIEHVWDSELDPFSNVVDVYIGYLRTKIDKAFPTCRPLVQTYKGLGYSIRK